VTKILTVIGARPQFVKSAPVSAALAPIAREIIVHTGQHYDPEMSDVFFQELGLKSPEYNLNVGSGSHGAQTGDMLKGVEAVILDEKPDMVMVYGDTNSTLAGALAASKLQIPVAHVEAGLRSFNRAMPEELNRIVTDHLSTLLFAPSETSERQLREEGITEGVHVTGDVMYDSVLHYAPIAARVSRFPGALNLKAKGFYLCTIHRAENTDDSDNLRQIMSALDVLPLPVILPLHPRTKAKLGELGILAGSNIRITEPVGYIDILQLLQSSAAAITDSGGLQKEAYYLGVPCITLRSETEWTETVEAGWNRLAGCDEGRIVDAVEAANSPPAKRPELYGDGKAAARIAEILAAEIKQQAGSPKIPAII
jgi:UDP-N-acetylglucosamine 2-epimerase